MQKTKWNKPAFLLPITIESIYLYLSLTTTPPLIITTFALPALFIIPGAMLLTISKKHVKNNITEVLVEGFFVSTLLAVVLTSIMLAISLPLTPLTYTSIAFVLTLILTAIALAKKIEIKPNKTEITLIALALSSYVILLFIFSRIPRLFTPDETSYIFSARMGITERTIPPMGVRPNKGEITAVLEGRYLWIYILTSFLGSTGLPPYQAGLLGISFLIMTALASSLIVKNKWSKIIVFLIVVANPLLLTFSALTLNDLAISFFTAFAALFFIKAFTKDDNNISINITNLFYSLIAMIVVTLIKPNLMLFTTMWIILIYILLKYKLYKQNRKYKILLISVTLPVLIYEICFDIPYVISVWILKSRELADLFGKLLFISPAEKFLSLFVAPWWNPNATTLFTRNFRDYLDYFYGVLMPESSSLIISAIIIALPIFIFPKENRKEIDKTILASLILLSLYLNYFQMLSTASLGDASRYSLWIVPLWIPIAVMMIKNITEKPSFKQILPIFISAIILLWINIWLSKEVGGVYIGYGLPSRLWTVDTLIIQLILLIAILSSPFLESNPLKIKFNIIKKLSAVKAINLNKSMFAVIIILTLVNGLWYSTQFFEYSTLYEEHSFLTINDTLDNYAGEGSLVFANNYIYMRPYVSDKILNGLLLPPPDTKEEFLKLLEITPDNTTFLISNDSAITWYEYANNYIKDYIDYEIITPEKPNVSKLPRINLTEPILAMTFDDANETTIIDNSGFGNNGENYGASIVEGYHGKALQFDGKEYVSIPNSDTLNVQNEITISFLAKIEAAEPQKGYMILSKGYAAMNGSYHVFIWDSYIYFSIGEYEGSKRFLSFPASDLIGSWHSFVFTYDGKALCMFIDGNLVASKPAKGPLKHSNFDLEIGRDGERKYYYFIGNLDELQISDRPLNLTDFIKCYFKSYAFKIKDVSLPEGKACLFKLVKSSIGDSTGHINVLDVKNTIDKNYTIALNLEIESDVFKNISILIATDRFTKVYNCSLNIGRNNVTFTYPYIRDSLWHEPGGTYWLHLNKPRIILIDGDKILFNGFATVWNLEFMNTLMLSLTTALVFSIILINFKWIWKDTLIITDKNEDS